METVDTKVALRIAEDRMHAFLSLTPPQGGGRTPNVKILENYLKKKGVTYGIDRIVAIQQAANDAQLGWRDASGAEMRRFRAVDVERALFALADTSH